MINDKECKALQCTVRSTNTSLISLYAEFVEEQGLKEAFIQYLEAKIIKKSPPQSKNTEGG
jgi:hypothetical protein